jgi:NAD(P)-dependent dehydrogenase (short-subunit alcohol dehydrogenase family)
VHWPQIKAMVKFTIPFGEFGDPEDIGEAAAFLAPIL